MNALARPADWAAVPLAMRSVARSHVGLVRQINEDRVFDWAGGGLWAVIDGMGGHRGGDQAAQSVVDALRALQGSDGGCSPGTVLATLATANRSIVARNARQGEQAGATIVALALCDATVFVAWAGDSRCYRIRDGIFTQLTRDHSVVQDLIDAGILTPAAAAHHPQANVITRALGVDDRCEIESALFDYAPGDRFLLCTDGLSRSLEDADLTDAAIEVLADTLVGKALHRDGSDNISLVLVEGCISGD